MSNVLFILLANLALAAGMLGIFAGGPLPGVVLMLAAGALTLSTKTPRSWLRHVVTIVNGLVISVLAIWCMQKWPPLLMMSVAVTGLGWLAVWHLCSDPEQAPAVRHHRQRLILTVCAMLSLVPFWLGLRHAALGKDVALVKVAMVLLGLLSCFISWLGLHGSLLRRGAARFTIAATLTIVLTGAFLVASSSAHAVIQAPAWSRAIQSRYQRMKEPPQKPKKPTKPKSGMQAGGDLAMELPPTPDKISNTPRAFLMLTRETAQSGIKYPFYLRRKAFDHFTGKRWSNKDQNFDWRDDKQDGNVDGWVTVARPMHLPLYDHAIFIPGQRNHEMLSLPNPCQVGVPLLMRGPNDSYLIPARQGQNIGYTVRSSYFTYDEIRRKPFKPGTGMNHCLQLPPTTTVERLRADTVVLLEGTSTPRQRLDRIFFHIRRNYRYSNKRLPPLKDALAEFLYDRKQGHCTLFATTFTLMLRTAGFPARVATGYYRGRFDSKASVFMFNDHDRHAWTEVYLDEYGWVPIDCTPASASPPQPIVDSGFSITAEQLEFLGTPRLGLTPKVQSAKIKKNQAGHYGRQIAICFMAAVVAGAFCSLLMIIRRIAAPRPVEGYASARRDPSYFRLFCRHFAKCGCSRRRSQTAREYTDALKSRGLIGNEFDEMLAYFYDVRYAGAPADRRAESRFKKQIKALKPDPSR